MISSNLALFSKIFKNCPEVHSVAELGCNIGLNLIALNRINKQLKLRGYEINEKAAKSASEEGIAEIVNTTVVESLDASTTFDLTFTKGVLIHVNPDMLPAVYQNLYDLSSRYIFDARPDVVTIGIDDARRLQTGAGTGIPAEHTVFNYVKQAKRAGTADPGGSDSVTTSASSTVVKTP